MRKKWKKQPVVEIDEQILFELQQIGDAILKRIDNVDQALDAIGRELAKRYDIEA